MALELSLRFTTADQVSVHLVDPDGVLDETTPQPFAGPLDEAARKDLHWYLEVYPAAYMADEDDQRAAGIARKLDGWGEALFQAVFAGGRARDLMQRFRDTSEPGRLITISASHPAVLAQPWELLYDHTYLFLEKPRISIRRRLAGAIRPHPVRPKDRLHLLFVVSRPDGVGFLDPRADPQAVMDAIDTHAPGRISVEFLRPATLSALVNRLEDEAQPAVDIIHFDGHGTYDADGSLAESAGRAHSGVFRDATVAVEPHQGYLLFENAAGQTDLVPASRLGEVLHRQKVGLMVLSACQSAMIGGEDPLGSVAARLTQAGLPSVLAMTQSVLVATTRALFGDFYRNLAKSQPIGTALDNARRELYLNPRRGERQRGGKPHTLKLQDWFLPALYQSGSGGALLSTNEGTPEPAQPWGNLPDLPETGFFGRTRELWWIERQFTGKARRLVLHGFGGQGKTFLAQEAGRWLHRTGLFQLVCFVDYASFQGIDPVSLAVSTLATVLDQSLIDAAAATRALAGTPTLLILDNLESLSAEPLRELLDAAVAWSKAGGSRVLITTRCPDLEHPAYPTANSWETCYLPLDGLDPHDALAWFTTLMHLPPEPTRPPPDRDGVLRLFSLVQFHPLSIGLLAPQLKQRGVAELGQRLEALLRTEASPLLASLALSLERLDPQLRQHLPGLGVFQGGAFEISVLAVTEIPPEPWAALRRGLEQTGLMTVETVPGVENVFLRFPPTLAPALWSHLPAADQSALAARHRAEYDARSRELYALDETAVHAARAIARRELPNLLVAVEGALAAGEPEAVVFVDKVGRFLGFFGLSRDRERLLVQAQAAAGPPGSKNWYLSRSGQGKALLGAERVAEAAAVFRDIRDALDSAPSVSRCNTLGMLARCLWKQGQLAEAGAILHQALAEARRLGPSRSVRRLIGVLESERTDLLRVGGDLDGAAEAGAAALAIVRELGDDRSVAFAEFQLSTIHLFRNDLQRAEKGYRAALAFFHVLGEPREEASALHQLGVVLHQAKRWDEAEVAYRESARLKEASPLLAAATWQQLAQLLAATGHPAEAETWYRKALTAFRDGGDPAQSAFILNNLAELLRHLPGRLAEARSSAEQALVLKETRDPAAAEIWNTYGLLAAIAAQESRSEAARAYRAQARQSFAAAPIARETLRRAAPGIAAVRAALAQPTRRHALERSLDDLAQRGRTDLVAALRQVLDGARDADALCEPLDFEDSLIVATTLRALADPSTLAALLPEGS